MTIRKAVALVEAINNEYGAPVSPSLRRDRRSLENPLAGKPPGADLQPLIDYSIEFGASLTETAATRHASPELRCVMHLAM